MPRRLPDSKVGILVDGLGDQTIPVGMDVEPVLGLLNGIADANAGGQSTRADVSAFVGQGEQDVSPEEAAQLMPQMQASAAPGSASAKINAAAQSLVGGQYQAAIDAYQTIAQQHPEETGTCYGQIGAALFFLKHYGNAIQYYEAAKQHGADPSMMDENIAEARGIL